MLTKKQEKLILSLHTKKGRLASGLCLVEGKKNIDAAGKSIEFIFTEKDTNNFKKLVSTETPQPIAALARIPRPTMKDIIARPIIVLLDGVQDPGNVGAIIRLCLGFNASLLLVDSADPTSPKVIRSSAGAVFSVPWQTIPRTHAEDALFMLNRPVYRLEKSKKSDATITDEKIVLIAGSEGRGILLPTKGKSFSIQHNSKLESLNVGHALAIVLAGLYRRTNC